MPEHVRDSCLAARIVHRPRVHVGMERDHGRIVTLQNDEMQAVGKRELRDPLFELLQGLGGTERGAEQRQGKAFLT